MVLLSGDGECLFGFDVGGVFAEHDPNDVDASACEGEECLLVCFTFGAFAVIERSGGGPGFQARSRSQVAGSQQSAVEASGAVQVAADSPGVARHRC